MGEVLTGPTMLYDEASAASVKSLRSRALECLSQGSFRPPPKSWGLCGLDDLWVRYRVKDTTGRGKES
jgi:hypothetical protein